LIHTFGDGVVQSSLRVVLVRFGQDSLLVGFLLVAAEVDFRDEEAEIGVGAEGSLRNQFLATCGALFVARAQSCDYAFRAEAVETLFRHDRSNVQALDSLQLERLKTRLDYVQRGEVVVPPPTSNFLK
jgi:hypothetical protein